MRRIGIIGGGSWATALTKILCDNQEDKTITWWVRTEEKAHHLRTLGHNPDYIRSVEFRQSYLTFTSDLQQCISQSDWLILAVPSAFVESALLAIHPDDLNGKVMISAVKGLIPTSGQIIGTYLKDHWKMTSDQIAVITGPCHAEEVALERLSYLTVASENTQLAGNICASLNGRYIKTTSTDDIYGTEYSAVLKNVCAMAAGVCHAMGYGDNFLSVLVSNAIREIKRFIQAVHPITRDIDDSAYLGDLIVTAYSQFSRNRTFGHMLGKGYSVKSAQLEMNMIAEGYYATKSMYELNKNYQVDMPILDFMHAIIYQGKSPKTVIGPFLDRLN